MWKWQASSKVHPKLPPQVKYGNSQPFQNTSQDAPIGAKIRNDLQTAQGYKIIDYLGHAKLISSLTGERMQTFGRAVLIMIIIILKLGHEMLDYIGTILYRNWALMAFPICSRLR